MIKPSGSDQTVAIVSGERVLVQPKGLPAKLYRYQLQKRGVIHNLIGEPIHATCVAEARARGLLSERA